MKEQDRKEESMILMHHKHEMHSKVNKENKEQTKPAVVYECNLIQKIRCYRLICLSKTKVLSGTWNYSKGYLI